MIISAYGTKNNFISANVVPNDKMNVFPSTSLKLNYNSSRDETLNELEKNTEISDDLKPYDNSKKFLGTIKSSEFSIRVTKVQFGFFCSINGKFNDNYIDVILEINPFIKNILKFFLLVTLVMLIINLTKDPINFASVLFTLGLILGVKYYLIDYKFKTISKTVLNSFVKCLNLKK